MTKVIKIGGHNLDEPNFLEQLAETLCALMPAPLVIVHGGGKEISQLQAQMGLTPTYIDGLRVTDDATLEVAEMVLGGLVNSRIVRTLQQHGLEAQGMTGIDRGLICATKLQHPNGDLGHVGTVTKVRGEILQNLIAEGVIPVISTICLGENGALNVNADMVAGAVAQALNADEIVFITNTDGILHEDKVIPQVTVQEANELIANGVIYGGMIPKLKTALELIESGIGQVLISSLHGMKTNTGTIIVP